MTLTKGQKVSFTFYGKPETATIERIANGIVWLDNGRWMHETSVTPVSGRSRKQTWDVYWSPEGRKIAEVEAITARQAMRKAPQPYRKYAGELYAVEHGAWERYNALMNMLDREVISVENGARPQLDDNGQVKVENATCGTCEMTWNDALITSKTPAPSARCPYEHIHEELAEIKALRVKLGIAR